MNRIRTTLVLALLGLLVAPAAWAANDFSKDPNCVAVWRFENGALWTDSTANANTLTPMTGHVPTVDTTNYREGAASGLFTTANDQWAYRGATDRNPERGPPRCS